MDTGIFLIFYNKNIVSLLVLPTYKTQSILEPIFKFKKCDLYPSIYGIIRYIICVIYNVFSYM